MAVLHTLVFFLVMPTSVIGNGNHNGCPSPQYIQLGRMGIVECSFQEGLYGVVWYDKDQFSSGQSFLQFINGEKNGDGYYSGEFDILANGSLVIRNVTLQHDHSFTVATFESDRDLPVSLDVNVVVTVKPPTPFPVITLCGESRNTCFRRLQNHSSIACFLRDTRPPVSLSWAARDTLGKRKIAFQASVTNNGPLFTSLVTTSHPFSSGKFLTFLSCMAEGPPGLLVKNETTIFIENNHFNFSTQDYVTQVVERGTRLKLICPQTNSKLIVWRKGNQSYEGFHLLSYAALLPENHVIKTCKDEYILQADGSLFIPRVETKHEAFYRCLCEGDKGSGTELFKVVVFVRADPVVHGCTDDNLCILEKPAEGSLTCSVTGVRPLVNLEWKILNEGESVSILFFDHSVSVHYRDDNFFNVILTSNYRTQNAHTNRIAAECRMSSPDVEMLTSSVKFDLLIETDKSSPGRRSLSWVLPIIITLCLLVILLFCLYIKRGRRRKQTQETTEEEEAMITTPPSHEALHVDKRSAFLQELKVNYMDQYDAIQPIPFLKDRLYRVKDIFVNGGCEKLDLDDKDGNLREWKKLNSHDEIFSESNLSTRTIIESEPGYGKSTFMLKLAYDWCLNKKKSPLAHVDIFILLKLRQMREDLSIFAAIKQFILPRDSSLSENDIKNIMQESESTLIILDGFDEYPDIETDKFSDIISVIRRGILQQSLVILTTRSFILPESYPPRTNRIRLTGFDESARNAYLLKAVVKNNKTEAKFILQSLQDNPVLRGLCQVPLFFVMFAHMTHETKTAFKITSVTSFFRHMISCFHRHLKNKMKNTNIQELTSHEFEHAALDEVAYDSLSRKKIVWDKQELCNRLGKPFYNHYKRLGILVEEVFDVVSDTGEVENRIEVRFFHQLFCEWYAANCLSRKVTETKANFQDILQKINPINHQYVYRFACGLNQEAGKIIISHLKAIEGGDNFAILCMLEQRDCSPEIMETVRKLCSDYVKIDKNDNDLYQCSVVQLLDMGAANQIPVPFLWLQDCLKGVDLSSKSIILNSNLSIPAMSNLREIAIGRTEKELEEVEFYNVLSYASLCTSLKVLRFCSFKITQPTLEIETHLSVLKSRSVGVLWITNDEDYCLNFLTGKWEEHQESSNEKILQENIPARTNFLKVLMKKKYKELTSGLLLAPCTHDTDFTLNQIFVECVIECLTKVSSSTKTSVDNWKPVPSYKDILKDISQASKRYILEGKAGFGKSILALRMASDWCNNDITSPFSKFDLFFLVKLSMGDISSSIYKQLKCNILPKNSPLGWQDIKSITQGCPSVLMVLDDYNLIADNKIKDKSNIINIIKGESFPQHHVIITSRCVPKHYETGAQRFRLSGFDGKAKEEYVEKATLSCDVAVAEKINRQLQETPARDLCEIPLFLTIFVLLNHKNNSSELFKSAKSLFTCFLKCLYGHMQNKVKWENVPAPEISEENYIKLGKVAFKWLCENRQFESIARDKNAISKEIGHELLDQLVRIGIFDEHEQKVVFFHNVLCEWYAAHYIADCVAKLKPDQVLEDAKALKLELFLNLCSFACEINNDIVSAIVGCAKDRADCHEFVRLTLFKYNVESDIVFDIVKDLCSRTVELNQEQKKILEESALHLLEVAVRHKIPIPNLKLHNCFSKADLGGKNIQLKSGALIPVLKTLKMLTIRAPGYDIHEEEIKDILQYAEMCSELEELRFYDCLLPQYVRFRSMKRFKAGKVQVLWYGCLAGLQCKLDVAKGSWRHTSSSRGHHVINDKEYKEEVERFRKTYKR